jgi:GMP synthase (glutamine-hydrolysing)
VPNIHFFQHLPHERCGNIERWARRRGRAVSRTRFARGEMPPADGDIEVLVIMGCARNVYQYRDYPCLPAQRKFAEQFLTRGGKVLGICHGAQVLADILGGRVYQNPFHEIGWHPLTMTAAAKDSSLSALPDGQRVLHWHGDNFDLPRGATLLASSAACPRQAFSYGAQILALQFHLEIGPGDLDALIEDCRDDFKLSGPWIQTEAEIRAGADRHAAAAEQFLGRVMDAFVGN